MKIRILTTALICAIVALPVTRAQEKKDDQTEMGAKMEKASGAWRAAKKQADKPEQKVDTLAKLATVKENLNAALKYEPAKTADVPEADRAKFLAAFRDKLKMEIANVEKVEAAVKAGAPAEEIGKLIGEVDKTQKEGHTEFKKKKEKK
jgi:hypothetical protein